MECLLRTNMRQNLQVGRPGRPGRARVLGAAHMREPPRRHRLSGADRAADQEPPRSSRPRSRPSCWSTYPNELIELLEKIVLCRERLRNKNMLKTICRAQQLRHFRNRQHHRRIGAEREGSSSSRRPSCSSTASRPSSPRPNSRSRPRDELPALLSRRQDRRGDLPPEAEMSTLSNPVSNWRPAASSCSADDESSDDHRYGNQGDRPGVWLRYFRGLRNGAAA